MSTPRPPPMWSVTYSITISTVRPFPPSTWVFVCERSPNLLSIRRFFFLSFFTVDCWCFDEQVVRLMLSLTYNVLSFETNGDIIIRTYPIAETRVCLRLFLNDVQHRSICSPPDHSNVFGLPSSSVLFVYSLLYSMFSAQKPTVFICKYLQPRAVSPIYNCDMWYKLFCGLGSVCRHPPIHTPSPHANHLFFPWCQDLLSFLWM